MNEPSWKITARTIVLAVLIGGASGVLTSALTNNYLSTYALQLGDVTAPLRLSEERPRAYPQSYEEALTRVNERAVPGLVTFYRPERGASASYGSDQALFNGAVLTSDGWILTAQNASLDLSSMVAVVGRETLAIKQVVQDPAVGVTYVKVDGQNLPVFAFGNGLDSESGDQAFLVPSAGSVLGTHIVDADWRASAVLSSDRPSRQFVFETRADEVGAGTPAVNPSGELIGITVSNTDALAHVVPIDVILPGFTSFLRVGTIQRPALGAEAIDLTRAVGISEELSGGNLTGALLYGATAVKRGSAAEIAGLKAGDIILSVDGELVNTRTLDEQIMGFKPGQTVTVLIVRGEQQKTMSVTLGTLQ